MNPKQLSIVFVGSLDRGMHLQKVVGPKGWKIKVVTTLTFKSDRNPLIESDLVILDNFPDSHLAKSVFFDLRSLDAGPFLALNNSPSAKQFIHVNALPFLKLIDRNPKPEDLINAINAVVKAYPKRLCQKEVRQNDGENGSVQQRTFIHRERFEHRQVCPAPYRVK